MSNVHASSSRNRARLAALACAVILSFFLATTAGPASAGDHAQPTSTPRLDSHLADIVDTFRRQGTEAAAGAARRLDVDVDGDAVRVIIEARPGDSEPAIAAAVGRGAAVEGTYQNLVQALVPIASLEALARAGPVEFVRLPLRAVPMVTGEGVALINADGWQTQGVTGAGVKVAVLDLGFQGYASLLGTELPNTVTVMSFRADGDIAGGTPGTPHGTAVAEIVHEVAPGAELYLVNFDTEVELANASAWLTSQGAEVINASWGFFVSGPGDGTGLVNDIVSTSTAAGTLWSVAAANHALRHYSALFLDSDDDLFHEFQNVPFQDEGNQITGAFFGLAFPGEVIGAELKWDDDFGAACRDYDLYLKRTDDVTGEPITVASSETVQNDGTDCVPGADPIESLTHTVTVADTYHLVIKESAASSDAFVHLYSFFHDIEYMVPAGSISQPADNPDALAVAAVNWCTPNTIEPYSSRGPTTDNRTKPDLAGPDGVSNTTYPPLFACTGFSGTSAAAPHITGAAALVRQLLPCYTPAQLQAYLEASAVDLGDPGKDNTFGSGRLLLGDPPLDSDGDGMGDGCDPDDDDDSLGLGDAFGLFFRDEVEAFLVRAEDPDGLDPLDACADTATANDEDDDKSGYDFDDNQSVDGSDVSLFAERFGTEKDVPAPVGKQPYIERFDIYPTDTSLHKIDGSDVSVLGSYFGLSCS